MTGSRIDKYDASTLNDVCQSSRPPPSKNCRPTVDSVGPALADILVRKSFYRKFLEEPSNSCFAIAFREPSYTGHPQETNGDDTYTLADNGSVFPKRFIYCLLTICVPLLDEFGLADLEFSRE